ncbi:MAG: molybdenum ABC transporter ATP-binding protein [Deltaproteobacteria bacterium]|nr:molybdenum ABC transporter ATP-binding protein [Deltaproteobacteria bacterium]
MKLSLKNVKLSLSEISFSYDTTMEGGIFGVFGVSGSGKSTLMKVICGIERAHTGQVIFNDTVFFDSEKGIHIPPHKRQVGVVFQEHYLFPHLTIAQNLTFGSRYTTMEKISFSDVIALLDLAPLMKKKPSKLSGGERQRVAIGRALLQQPRMLLLDEPFSNLDRSRRKQIISYLLKIHNRFGIPLLIISHDLEDILRLTQSIIIIECQSIKATGDYLHIAEQAIVPHLITPRRFINIVELVHQAYLPKQRINHFGATKDGPTLMATNSGAFSNERQHGRRVRLAIAPDDIALGSDTCRNISMQNQLQGTVTHILHMNDSFYVTLDCGGISLVSEITPAALYQLDVKPGAILVCLFKAKAVEIVHIFENGVQKAN